MSDEAEGLVYRLRKRAEIRAQIASRKSVQEGKPDRIGALLVEAAAAIEAGEAQAAAMREALEDIRGGTKGEGYGYDASFDYLHRRAQEALTTDAGKALLERLANAEQTSARLEHFTAAQSEACVASRRAELSALERAEKAERELATRGPPMMPVYPEADAAFEKFWAERPPMKSVKLKDVRAQAIEECAKVAETKGRQWGIMRSLEMTHHAAAARAVAAAIRALLPGETK